jgi:serine/threonine protein kinase
MGNTGAQSGQSANTDAVAAVPKSRPSEDNARMAVVMREYKMDMSKDGVMGAGTSSICRKGIVIKTGEEVGIKVYKPLKSSKKSDADTRMMKFRRQVEVLKELQDPFVKPSDPRLWCSQMEKAKPERLFMTLIDCSKDAAGEPGLDFDDNEIYVITELAWYSLKDFIAQRKASGEAMSKATVRDMTKAVVYVMAGLHAKGFVHLDLKPENLMVFDGALKLIDVDGCVKVGMKIAITNPSISFSPCYCSPEWANFLLSENAAKIAAVPALDVWSLGCTICEFVTLDAILKPMYANFLRHSHSHREAGFLFMDWLSTISKAPTPKTIEDFDKDLASLISDWMLINDKDTRKTCAECLSHPFLSDSKLHHSKTNPLSKSGDGLQDAPSMPNEGVTVRTNRTSRSRAEDTSSKAVKQGQLWKLNQGADPRELANWLQRDMWFANNGSLCYFSPKDSKRLVLLDSHKLHNAVIEPISDVAREHAFQIKCDSVDDGGAEAEVKYGSEALGEVAYSFAATTADERDEWLRLLQKTAQLDVMPTMRLGASYGCEIRTFILTVRNRRMKVEDDSEQQFAPIFQGTIWKVRSNGDPLKEEDWFQRKTWLSRNGSLVYYSIRDSRELIYYTSADINRAQVSKTDDSKSAKPFAFEVTLPPHEGMEFQKGVFAAESEELREKWLQQFAQFRAP